MEEAEIVTELSDDEKKHIRLVEEYRSEVRAALKADKSEGWKDKILYPSVVVLVTALAGGLVVPYVLRVHDDHLRAVELQSRLIEDVVTQSATAKMSLERYHDQLCDYWSAIIPLALQKASVKKMRQVSGSAGDIKLETERIVTAFSREHMLRIEVDKQFAQSCLTFEVAKSRTESQLHLYVGRPNEVTQYLATSKAQFEEASKVSDTDQDALQKIFKSAVASFESCKEKGCEAPLERALQAVESIRKKEFRFVEWERSKTELADYLLRHLPNIRGTTSKIR